VKSELGPPMTLGVAAAAGVRLIVCCKACQHGSNLTRGRAGPALRRRDQRSRLARPAGVLAVREPAGRHGGQRDQAARIDSGRCPCTGFSFGLVLHIFYPIFHVRMLTA